MTRIHRRGLAISFVACLFGACGETAGGYADAAGPLSLGGSIVSDCMNQPPDHRTMTFGQGVIEVTGTASVTIDSVTLVHGHGFIVGRVILTPVTGRSIVGESDTFPPAAELVAVPGYEWAKRVTVPAALDPTVKVWNILIEIDRAPGTTVASSDGTEVKYRNGSDRLLVRSRVGVVLTDAEHGCR